MRTELRAIFAITVILLISAVPFTADDSESSAYVSCEGLDIATFDDSVSMKTGGSCTILLTVRNIDTSDISVRLSYITVGVNPVSGILDKTEFTVSPGDAVTVTVTLSVGKMSEHGDFSSAIYAVVYNYGTSASGTVSLPLSIYVMSEFSSSDSFNKIMGFVDNNLPAPFNGPETSVTITAIIWLIIAAVAYVVVYFIAGRVFKNEEHERKDLIRMTGTASAVAVLLSGASQCLLVYGIDDRFAKVFIDVSQFLHILIISFIVWNIYKNLVTHFFHKMEKEDKLDGVDSSLSPLFHMIGKIVVVVAAAALILNLLGFDLIGILTGAGIIGIAVSFGAQNTIAQFFSGLMLLINRPFKIGDMVKIDSSGEIYEVIKVGLMNCTFKNWCNYEHVTVPNNSVTSSAIINITGKTLAYRIFLYYSVAYESDFDLVKEVLLKTANANPRVITNGSYSKPDVRVYNYADSTVDVRLAVYITNFNDNVIVSDELYTAGYRDLEEAGVDIPYEKYDIRVIIADDEGES